LLCPAFTRPLHCRLLPPAAACCRLLPPAAACCRLLPPAAAHKLQVMGLYLAREDFQYKAGQYFFLNCPGLPGMEQE
jgi:hypothetical protein